MNSTRIKGKKILAASINVRFVSAAPLNLTIKQHPMKFKPTESVAIANEEAKEMLPRISETTADALPKANGKLLRLRFANVPPRLKDTEFFLEAPTAHSVKLAADFTDWDRFPLDMIQSFDGVWWTIVPLLPGNYTYRFIVDGQWCDDPRAPQRVPNPFGTSNAVVSVA